MLSDEFGPWHEHDGGGRPVSKGTVVEVEAECITGLVKRIVSMANGSFGTAWDWRSVCLDQPWRVLRYRVRKPRGMIVLERMIEDIPEKVSA